MIPSGYLPDITRKNKERWQVFQKIVRLASVAIMLFKMPISLLYYIRLPTTAVLKFKFK
jgi:hypothetical protein